MSLQDNTVEDSGQSLLQMPHAKPHLHGGLRFIRKRQYYGNLYYADTRFDLTISKSI